MAGPALSDRTLRLARRVFPPGQQSAAIAILENSCGSNLPFMADANPQSMERLRFAVLKLSGGQLPELNRAVALASTDWRDVLVAARFAESLDAHDVWFREQIDEESSDDPP